MKLCTLACLLSAMLFVVHSEKTIAAPSGGFIAHLFKNESPQTETSNVEKTVITGQITTLNSATIQPTAALIQLSDVVGIYELVSCEVRYSDGTIFRCSDYTFTGDAAISPRSTIWQRINVSGFPTLVKSGVGTFSNNTLTFVDDLDGKTSVSNVAWDGQFATLTFVEPGFEETDVYRRIVAPSEPCPAPSDVDADGVIDNWDNCPNTPVGSYIDSNGCPVSIGKCGDITPIYNLLLDEHN